MTWGDLDQFPLRPDVWGTAAEWAGALLTGGALLIAALVYRRDSNLSKASQARQIRPRIISRDVSDPVRVLVENYSENSIFRVGVTLRRTSFYRAFLIDSADSLLDPDQRKRKVGQLVKPTSKKYRQVKRTENIYDVGAERLKGNDLLEYRICLDSPFQQVFVTFIDTRGQHWEFGDLAAERQQLRKVANTSHVNREFRYPKARLLRPLRAIRELARLFMARVISAYYELEVRLVETVMEAFSKAWDEGNYTAKLSAAISDAFKDALTGRRTSTPEQETKSTRVLPDQADSTGPDTLSPETTSKVRRATPRRKDGKDD
ncbi:hypothetical protein [Mycobacteroides salmoniphilum]|uniref:hypothetical protein n=1 Tax=Mycobacteroides salmoniphilum TaxID=404941 RepID=UPI000992CC59|nr:hypothetical protein [Mycobacteroides salmoniphilum]